MPDFMRHDLVWLPDDKIPYVVTRQLGVSQHELQVARQLDLDKTLLSRQIYSILPEQIIKHERPLALGTLVNSFLVTKIAENINLDKLKSLLLTLENNSFIIRCYGSFMWEYYTGRTFTNDDSDLDIVCYVSDFARLGLLQSCLDLLSKLITPELDGELVFFNKLFIAYNEWFDYKKQELLIKTNTDVILQSRTDILNYAAICS